MIKVEKKVPSADASNEEKRQAQMDRAEKYGIEALDDANLSYQSGDPESEDEYGDPVNLKFPLESAERARNARVRFKQFANEIYSQEKSKVIVHERIVRAEMKFGIEPSFDPEDSLDKLLPNDLKQELEKSAYDITKSEKDAIVASLRKGVDELKSLLESIGKKIDKRNEKLKKSNTSEVVSEKSKAQDENIVESGKLFPLNYNDPIDK